MDVENIFMGIPEHLNIEIIEILQQSEHVKIERIVSTGQTSPETGWYDQPQNEWVMLLEGEAVVTFEDREEVLNVGDYMNIPAHAKHRVSWTHPQKKTLWLAVHY